MLSHVETNNFTKRNTVYNYRPKIGSFAPSLRKMSEKAASAESSNPVDDEALTDTFWVDKVARWAFPLAYFIFGTLKI